MNLHLPQLERLNTTHVVFDPRVGGYAPITGVTAVWKLVSLQRARPQAATKTHGHQHLNYLNSSIEGRPLYSPKLFSLSHPPWLE